MEEYFQIELTKDKVTRVDEDIWHQYGGLKWYAHRGGNKFYAMRSDRSRLFLHRIIMAAPEGMEVDHVNGDGLDNRRCNLRICTHHQNTMNRSRYSVNPAKKGCYWEEKRKRWHALITYQGKPRNIGRYKTLEECHAAYCRTAKELFGEFMRAN
jgi:hypothetical protein